MTPLASSCLKQTAYRGVVIKQTTQQKKRVATMKRNLLICIWAGLMLGAAGITPARAQSTFITFSVDEASNLVNGTFDPPVPADVNGTSYGGTGNNQVYARGTFNGW